MGLSAALIHRQRILPPALLIPLKMKADKSGGDGQFPEAHSGNLETPAATRRFLLLHTAIRIGAN
jgi:hypothetical protein